MTRRMLTLGLTLVLSGCACMNATSNSADTAPAAVVSGFVTDLVGFDQFIALRPTPEQFRARYPDVHLVLPGQIATKELRMNNSRYFAQLDAEGRISGGRFS